MEILQNTIMKLVFRQGSDTERKKTIFTSGEPVFTTDTNRLFVGTGALSGGQLIGNKFLGTNPEIITLAPGEIGDTGYNPTTQTLHRIKYNDGSSLSDWETIAQPNTLLYGKYNGSLSAMEFSKGVSGTSLSAGHYRFSYNSFPTLSSYLPTVQVYGSSPTNCEARVISTSVSSCDVTVLSSTGTKTDATVSLVLNY